MKPITIVNKHESSLVSRALYSLSSLVLALTVSWLVLSKVDFGYQWLHHLLDIEQHSQQYGPLNKYRQDFALTNKAEHIRLFAAINRSVHHQGLGLADITYKQPNGVEIGKMLHFAEIQHLKDVANLLDNLRPIAFFFCMIWLILVGLCYFKRMVMPNVVQQAKSLGGIFVVVAALMLFIGPQTIFYTLHEWVFPEEHQWYFYYEESLMSTLMKAPDLFGAIAIVLSIVALFMLILSNWLANRLCCR